MMLAAALLHLVAACASPRPAGTDLFGRPLAQSAPTAASSATTIPSRTVSDGNPDDLLAGIELRPLPTPAQSIAASAIVPDARPVVARDYVVQPGDTLRGIGNRTGAGSEAIAIANALTAPYTIRTGQRLAIPAGRYHEVLAGQTGIAIARAYRVDWSAVIAENSLEPPYLLRLGQRLRLPAGAAPSRPLTPEEQARAFTLDIDDIVTGSAPASPGRSKAAFSSALDLRDRAGSMTESKSPRRSARRCARRAAAPSPMPGPKCRCSAGWCWSIMVAAGSAPMAISTGWRCGRVSASSQARS